MKTNRIMFMLIVFVALATLAAFDVSAATMIGGVMVAPVAALADAVSADELKAVAGEFKTAQERIEKGRSEMADQLKEVQGRLEKGETISKELKEAIDKVLHETNTQAEFIKEMEQKFGKRAADIQQQAKSIGDQLVESSEFKGYVERGVQGSMKMTLQGDIKAVTSTTAAGLIVRDRENDIVDMPRRRLTIRDLLPVVRTNTSSIEYPKQNVRTNAAAPVAESATKPYSDYGWTIATASVRTIAHLAKLTRQAVDDAPRLVGEVNQEMRYGLGLVEEAQILNGDGTGQNLNGIMPQATAFNASLLTGANLAKITRLDVLRIAMLQGALALYPATGIVLNDIDWAYIELTKTDDGAYLFSNPQGSVQPRLWNLPVVATQAQAVDNFLVGNFDIGATLYDRMSVEILLSSENADDFEKNLYTMRAEERIALAVKRATAFTKGVFAGNITDETP
jgi:HK97 family phage major capsid protein